MGTTKKFGKVKIVQSLTNFDKHVLVAKYNSI